MEEPIYNFERMTREHYCRSCNEYTIMTGPVPVCHLCGRRLVIVLYSNLTGRRITRGEDDATDKTP